MDPRHVAVLADGNDYGGDGGGVNWLQFLTPTTVLILVVAAFVLLFVVAVTGFVVYRKLKKRGLIEQGLMSLKAQALPEGPARELNELRLRLNRSVASTTRAVAAATASGQDISTLQRVTQRLSEVADGVDRDLLQLEAEPDTRSQQAMLGPARDRVEAVTSAASRVRSALLQESAALQEADAANVTADLDEEVSRLSSFTQAYRELGGGNSRA